MFSCLGKNPLHFRTARIPNIHFFSFVLWVEDTTKQLSLQYRINKMNLGVGTRFCVLKLVKCPKSHRCFSFRTLVRLLNFAPFLCSFASPFVAWLPLPPSAHESGTQSCNRIYPFGDKHLTSSSTRALVHWSRIVGETKRMGTFQTCSQLHPSQASLQSYPRCYSFSSTP